MKNFALSAGISALLCILTAACAPAPAGGMTPVSDAVLTAAPGDDIVLAAPPVALVRKPWKPVRTKAAWQAPWKALPPAEQKPVRLIAEGEDFLIDKAGWQVMPYRENYFASTFALTFLSRMACLSAPPQLDGETVAVQEVRVPYGGEYEVLARYEQPYDFTAEFTVEIRQRRKVVYRETFGRRDDVRIWGCCGANPAARRKPMVRFFWGATDNIVWQVKGKAKLAGGDATIRLIAGAQKDPNAAARNVDLICLTNDSAGREAQKKHCRTYLEMDGWLVQDGDLFVRMKNLGDVPVTPVVGNVGHGQHSPYYIHLRDWPTTSVLKSGRLVSKTNYINAGPRSAAVKPEHIAPLLDPAAYAGKAIPDEEKIAPGEWTGWVPMGQGLDSLHNCIWPLKAPARMDLEFAVPDGNGGLKTVRTLTVSGGIAFEMPGCVAPNADLAAILEERYWPAEIRTQEEALQWLLAEVKKFPKVSDKRAERFLIYKIMGWGGLNFETARKLTTALGDNTAVGYEGRKRGILTHWKQPKAAEVKKREAAGGLKDLYIVSYGDEMHLPAWPGSGEHFAAWLKARGVKHDGPVAYTTKKGDPLYYYSQLWAKGNGASFYAQATAILKKNGVLSGTNYSPHSNYLVSEIDYIRPFKLKAMTMPWSEDYVWQVPEFSVQVMGYLTAAFRAGAKYDNLPIHMYVMPHSPGNTPRDFRLSFYTAVAHGARMINYFCASPLAVAATENYIDTNDLAMWRAVHDCTWEAGIFEDYVMDGKVRPAKVGLLLSSVDEIMVGATNYSLVIHNNERKAVYYALRHAQVPVDFLSEDDVIDGLARDYKVIYVTQQWLHSRVVKALKKWAKKGGTIVALAGGGFLNEFNQPNPEAGELYGVKSQQLATDPDLLKYLLVDNKPFLAKQDLPPYKPLDYVTWGEPDNRHEDVGVVVWKQTLKPGDGKVIGTYRDGKAAVIEKRHGKGRAVLFGFLPGQAYLKSGLPHRPVDRGSTNDAFTHFLPTDMEVGLRRGIVDEFLPPDFERQVVCSETLVETTCIDTVKPKKRLAVPLMNYTGKPIAALTVTVRGVRKARAVRSVEHEKLNYSFEGGSMTVTLPLDVADTLLIDL